MSESEIEEVHAKAAPAAAGQEPQSVPGYELSDGDIKKKNLVQWKMTMRNGSCNTRL